MIEIISHKVNGLNEAIDIRAIDEPGPGGAHHHYELTLSTAVEAQQPPHSLERHIIRFQKGPIKENGVNGVSNEALLALVIHRLDCFQRGPFRCKDNEDALGLIKAGLTCLAKRTRARVAQGVEGTSQQHTELAAVTESALVGQKADLRGAGMFVRKYVWGPKGSAIQLGPYDSIEDAEKDIRELGDPGEYSIFDLRPATKDDASLFEFGEDAIDTSAPDWWVNRTVPNSIVRTVTIPDLAPHIDS